MFLAFLNKGNNSIPEILQVFVGFFLSFLIAKAISTHCRKFRNSLSQEKKVEAFPTTSLKVTTVSVLICTSWHTFGTILVCMFLFFFTLGLSTPSHPQNEVF